MCHSSTPAGPRPSCTSLITSAFVWDVPAECEYHSSSCRIRCNAATSCFAVACIQASIAAMTSFSCAGVGMAADKTAAENRTAIRVFIESHFEFQDLLQILFVDRCAYF